MKALLGWLRKPLRDPIHEPMSMAHVERWAEARGHGVLNTSDIMGLCQIQLMLYQERMVHCVAMTPDLVMREIEKREKMQ